MSSGYQYALVYVEYFIKFAVMVPTKNQMRSTTAKLFWEYVIQLYRCSKRILSDQGRNLESVIFSEL